MKKTFTILPGFCKKNISQCILLVLMASMLLSTNVFGQIALPNTTAVTENFDGMVYSGAGTSGSSTALLPANWKMSPANTGASSTWPNISNFTAVSQQYYATSPSTGGRYVWGNSVTPAEKAVGILTSGSYVGSAGNSIMAHYSNTNTVNLVSLTIAYDLERYKINSGTAAVTFSYSINGTTWTAVGAGNIATTDLPANATTTFDYNPSGIPTTTNCGVISKSGVSITGLNIAPAGNIYLRWILNTGNSNSQGIGIDNVSVVAGFASPSIVLSDNTLSGFTYMVGAGPSGVQSFTIGGTSLAPATSSLSIAPPVSGNYEISLSAGSGYITSGNLTTANASGGTLAATTVYVRLRSGLPINTYNGETITCSGGGAADETVTCNGTVTNFFNSLSDVVAVAASESATIPSTQNANAPLTIGTGAQVWSFTIRDGGGIADADNLPTIVNSIVLEGRSVFGNQVSSWPQAIKTVSLFDGATLVGTGVVTKIVDSSYITFSGLSIAVADNTSKSLTMRLSLNCGIGGANSDGDDFVFRLSNANFTTASSSTSSQKAAFAAVVSTNGSNEITVTATKLIYTQQPQTNVSINNNFAPAVTVKATDNCGNLDKDFAGTISITSTGTLNTSPQTEIASSGIASFPGIIHTVAGGPFTLTAASAGLASVVSNPFSVTISTVLNSGDLMFVGFDSYVSSAADKYSIANFVPILPSTTFIIGNIVYDVKALASVKQDRWYNGNGNLTNDLATLKFTYNGASNIAPGSIICISVDGAGIVTAITVNGVNAFASFAAENINGADAKSNFSNVNLSASNPDAVFLMQGTFSAMVNDGAGANYRTFTGNVFGGIQTYGSFKAFSAAADAVTPGNRVSKIHPSIECIAISTGGSPGSVGYYAFYNPGSLHVGSHRNLVKAIAAYSGSNWTKVVSDGGDNLGTTCTNTFTVSSNVSPGKWTGETSTDWYDCNNWDDFTVPGPTTDVLIGISALNDAQINYLSPKAAQFNNIADAKTLNIQGGRQLIIRYTGATVNTLNVAGDLTINTDNGLNMNDGVAGTIDGTLNLRGNWTNNFATGFNAGNSLINFSGNSTQTITTADEEIFYNFTNSNTVAGGVVLANNSANITVNNIFSLSNGTLTLNQNTLTLNGPAGAVIGSGTITGSNTSNLVIGGTAGGALGTLNFTAGGRLLNNITLNRTGAAASATLGTDLAVNTMATITAGTLNAGTNSFSGAGGLTMTGGELQVGRPGVTSPELLGAYSLTAGVVNFTGSGSQTVKAVNYYDLTSTSTGARVMANTGVIGIANVFTKGSNAYTFTGSTVDYNGTAANQNITAFTAGPVPGSTYENLTLSNALNTATAKTLTGATDVESDLNILNSISLKLGANYLTLKSTATKTARVAPVSNTASIDYSLGVGRFVVERYFPGRRKWRLITAPVTVDAAKTVFNSWQVGGASPVGSGTYVTGLAPTGAGGNGLDLSPQNNYSLRIFNQVTRVFDPVSNTNTQLIAKTLGGAGLPDNIGFYMFIRGERTAANVNAFNPSGAVLATTLRDTGKIQVQLYEFQGNPVVGQYVLVGNPYASPVDFTQLTRSGIANKFYAWDPGINGANGVGGYVLLDFAAGSVTTVPVGQTGYTQTQIIQSKQAVLVETSAAGSPSITFEESDKSSVNNLNLFRPSPSPLPSIAVNLHSTGTDNENVLADGVLVQLKNDYSDGLDHLDSKKLSNVNETFGIVHNGTNYMLERRKPLSDKDTIFFDFKRARQLAYRFNFMMNNMQESRLVAYLHDTYLNKRTAVNMNGDTWIDFAVTSDAASATANRFYVVFKKAFRFKNINAMVLNSDVKLQWAIETETANIEYEIERSADGKLFEKVATVANEEAVEAYNFIDVNLQPGIYYYRVKAISNNSGVYDYSDAVRVKLLKNKAEMYVYPNPVTNNVIGIKMNLAAVTGVYNVRLLTTSGQPVFNTRLQHNKSTAAEFVNCPDNITAGNYQLEITAPDKKKTVINVLIAKQ